MIGIYKIQNLINGKCYIGQSIDIEKRWKVEKNSAFNENSKSYSYPISKAFRKYGIENFDFQVLEICNKESLNEKEKYWIQYYDSYQKGYNQTLGGDSGSPQVEKDNILGIISDLKITNLYHKEIANKWNVSQELVQGINTGRYWYQTNEDYPLQKQHKSYGFEIHKYYCKRCGKEISNGSEYCRECANILQRKVDRPSKEELFNFLKNNKGNFTLAGKKYDVTDNAVRKWCKLYNIPFHSSDYKTKNETFENLSNATINKKVKQLDVNGNVINIFNSLGEAARAINKPSGGSHIGAVCRGERKTAYGFKWEFYN